MPLFSRNVQLLPPLRISSWRKIAIGTWKTAKDPSVYGVLELDVGPALKYIDTLREKTGLKITLSHFMGVAVARTLHRHPDINCILRFGKLYPRKDVDVFFQVASGEGGKELSGLTIRNAGQKTITEVAREMQEAVTVIRDKGDPAFRKSKKMMTSTPGILVGLLLDVLGFILYGLNIWSPLLGSPKDPFGSVMVTNIGPLGLDFAFAPLVAYSRVPLLMALGAARETPVVRNGALAIAKICNVCVTFDHRLIDGAHASQMVKTLVKTFAEPESIERLG